MCTCIMSSTVLGAKLPGLKPAPIFYAQCTIPIQLIFTETVKINPMSLLLIFYNVNC